jgi:two-component system sensor histidine kinase AgrC
MNNIQSIWIALTTPNEGLTEIIFNDFGIPFVFIELTLYFFIFTTVLNVKYNKKQYLLYLLFSSISVCITNLCFDKPYSSYVNMVVYPMIICIIFKLNILKGVLAEFLPMIIEVPIESLFAKFVFEIFNISYNEGYNIPLIRLCITLLIYLLLFLSFILLKNLKYKIILSNNLSKQNKIVLFINLIIGIITLWTQFYLICYYYSIINLAVSILGILTFIAYFLISIYSLIKSTTLDITKQSLEQATDYNITLKLLYDDIRTFRHDFGNIVQAIGGYIDTDDIIGLKEYYKQLQIDCEEIKSLEMLNPSSINNPAIYSLLTSKYHKATEQGIEIKLHISLDLENLNMKVYEFSRILGILLDNAIEACTNCNEKIINLEIRKDERAPRQLLLIQNTYSDKNIDLNRINEKGYTSKTNDTKQHGLGLWEVQKILRKSKNLNLYTTKDAIFFTQQLEMYNL